MKLRTQAEEAGLQQGSVHSLWSLLPQPGKGDRQVSHQPYEGGVQDQRGEPAQHAPRPAAAPRRGLPLAACRWDMRFMQEPQPGRRGVCPAELQFQLQLGGSERPWALSTSP